jgi:hypothetical protein
MIKFISIFLYFLLITAGFPQEMKLEKIEPPNWWANMKNNQIQLMLYGKDLEFTQARFSTNKIEINNIHALKKVN